MQTYQFATQYIGSYNEPNLMQFFGFVFRVQLVFSRHMTSEDCRLSLQIPFNMKCMRHDLQGQLKDIEK